MLFYRFCLPPAVWRRALQSWCPTCFVGRRNTPTAVGVAFAAQHCAPYFVCRAMRSRQWMSRRRVLRCTRGADLGPLVAPASANKLTIVFSQVLPSSGRMAGRSTKTQCPTCFVGGRNTPTAVGVAFATHTTRPTLLVGRCVHVSGRRVVAWYQRGRPWPAGFTISTRKKLQCN